MSEALEHLGDRLGIEEARSFATLIQQSAELGSSITEALRVYSDDMRHKRLSRAEEKAYSLPAKLSVPMMICIFPVLFVVILLPVFVRLHVGNYSTRYIDAWKFWLGTDAGGRGVGAAANQPATDCAGPLRNPRHRRRGAAELAHHRGVAARGLAAAVPEFARSTAAAAAAGLRPAAARSPACAAARGGGQRFRLHGGARRDGLVALLLGRDLRLARRRLEDGLAVDRGSRRRSRRRRVGRLGEIAEQHDADDGDDRGGHKLGEQAWRPMDWCGTRASPSATGRIQPRVRGRSGAQCGRFAGGGLRAAAPSLTRQLHAQIGKLVSVISVCYHAHPGPAKS